MNDILKLNSRNATTEGRLLCIDYITCIYDESIFGIIVRGVKNIYYWLLQVAIILLAILPNYVILDVKDVLIWVVCNCFMLILIRDKTMGYWFYDDFERYIVSDYKLHVLSTSINDKGEGVNEKSCVMDKTGPEPVFHVVQYFCAVVIRLNVQICKRMH